MKVPNERLSFFEELYKKALLSRDPSLDNLESKFRQYRGDTGILNGEDTEIVRNITYELIEAEISTNIPNPEVSSECFKSDRDNNAKRIETMLANMRNSLPFEKMNGIDERYTYIYGGSVWLIEWETGKNSTSDDGKIRISVLSPESLVPEPGFREISDMEYCFIRYDTPKSELVRRWGISYEEADALSSSQIDDTVETVICFYRNEKGYVSLYVFASGKELSYIDDYYSRKRTVCKKCLCEKGLCKCEDPKFVKTSSEYEILSEDIEKINGEKIPKGSKIRWYRPTDFPIVVRRNTSAGKSVIGESDCDFIACQQKEINKILSRVHEKLIMSGVYPYKPDGCSFRFDNSVGGKVLNLSPADSPSSFGVLDTTPDISRDLEYVEKTYEDAKRILGISDTFLGAEDSNAVSGKAKELEIIQAQGRLETKRQMKNAAYADIDRIAFGLMLAFSDERKTIVYEDKFGNAGYDSFSRYDFAVKDEKSGIYFYDGRYLFSSDSIVSYRRSDIWERNLENYKAGVFGDPSNEKTLLRYWLTQEKAHYPGAREIADYFR